MLLEHDMVGFVAVIVGIGTAIAVGPTIVGVFVLVSTNALLWAMLR